MTDNELYGSRLRRLAALRIRVTERQAKFKLGPYGPDELKRDVAARLRQRDRRPTRGRQR